MMNRMVTVFSKKQQKRFFAEFKRLAVFLCISRNLNLSLGESKAKKPQTRDLRLVFGVFAVLLVSSSFFFITQNAFAAEVAVDTTVFATNASTLTGSPTAVWITDQKGFVFYIGTEGDLEMASTTNGGTTWAVTNAVDSVNTTDVVNYAIWWDGWTAPGTTTAYIHIATTDTSVDDIYYTRVDTNSGTSSATVVTTTQAGTCVAGSCYVSITKASNNVLYVATADTADSWVDSCSTTCTSTVNWSERTSAYTGTLGDDFPLLAPIPGTNNIMLVWWDISLDDVIAREYSATSSTWGATTTLNATAEDNTTYDAQLMGISVSTSTGKIALVYTDDTDDYVTQDHDIDFWTYASSTGWVQGTDVVTDASGGLTGAKITYDVRSNVWFAIYSRRTTIGTLTTGNIYYRRSTDGGATWGSELGPVNDNTDDINSLTTGITSSERIGAWWNYTTAPRADQEYYDLVHDIGASTSISGFLYVDEGQTLITSPKTLGVAVGTTTTSVYTTTSLVSGAWSITIPNESFGTTTRILVWLDGYGPTTAGAVYTEFAGTGAVSGIDLYQNRVIIRREDSLPVSIEDMSFYDSDNDSDIQYNASSTNSTFTVFSGNELHVWTGDTFAPGGAVTINGNAGSGVDGSLHLPASSVYLQGGTTTLAGNFTASSSATYAPDEYLLILNATTTGKSIDASVSFGSVSFTGSGGSWTFAQNATATNLTIQSGATVVAPPALGITSSFNNQGTFTNNSGAVYLSGASSTMSGTLTGSSALFNLIASGTPRFGNATVTASTIYDATSSTDIAYAVTDDEDSLYVTGTCDKCGPGSPTVLVISAAKLSKSTGAVLWASTTNPSALTAHQGNSIVQDKDYIYLGGWCGACGALNSPTFYVRKLLKSTGALMWSTTTDQTSSNDQGYAMTQDTEHLYMSGYCTGCGGAGGAADFATVKYLKSTGAVVWSTSTAATSSIDQAQGITSDSDFLYVTGYTLINFATSNYGLHTQKLSKATGAVVWATTTDPTTASDVATSITSDSDNVYVTGNCTGCGAGGLAIYTIAYAKSNGSFVWSSIVDPGIGNDSAYKIVQDDTYLYLGGYCTHCVTSGNQSSYIVKLLKSTGTLVASSTLDANTSTEFTLGITGDLDYLYPAGYCTNCTATTGTSWYVSKVLKSSLAQVNGDNSLRLGSSASTTNITIGATGTTSTNTLYAPARLSIAGNFTQDDVFNAGTGTTTFNGTVQQTATGTFVGTGVATSSFYNLEVTNSSASTTFGAPFTVTNQFTATTPSSILEFAANATSTVGTASISGGAAGTKVKIRSTTPGTKAAFTVSTAYVVTYVDVKDSAVCGSTGGGITATVSRDSGNTVCWTISSIGPITISGVLYSDFGSTTIPSGKTVGLVISTSTQSVYTTTSTGNGVWSVTAPSNQYVTATSTYIIFVDADSNIRAATVVQPSDSSDLTGVNLYQNRVIVRAEGSGTVTTVNMAVYDGDNDSDIQYTANSGGLTVNKGQELYVWKNSTFAPTTSVTINGNAGTSTDGSLRIDGTFLPAGTTTLAGNFFASTSAKYTPNGSRLLFNATSTEKWITVATNTTLGNVIFNGSGGSWKFGSDNATTSHFTISTGTVTAPIGNLTVIGAFSNNGAFNNNAGTMIFAGASSTAIGTLTATSSLGNISIYGIPRFGTSTLPAAVTDPGVSSDMAFANAVDEDYIYVIGNCYGCGSLGAEAFYLIKYSKTTGNFVWATTTDPTANPDAPTGIILDQDHVYVSGGCNGCGPVGSASFYTIKYRKSDAGFVWSTYSDPTASSDRGYAIASDQDYIYTTGYCTGCGSLGDGAYYTVKLSKVTGVQVWATTTDPSSGFDAAYGIIADGDYLYVTGICPTCSALNGPAYHTIKYRKSDGSLVWATSTADNVGGTGQAKGITQDSDYVYITGYCSSCGTSGSYAFYTVKYSKSNGALQWSITTEASGTYEAANSITSDQDFLYITGDCTTCGSLGVSSAFFTVKLSKATGATLISTTSDPTSGADVPYGITADEDFLYVSGTCANCGTAAASAYYTEKYLKSNLTRVDGNNTMRFGSSASTSSFVIASTGTTTATNTVSAPSALTVTGTFSNGGVFTNNSGTIYFTGASTTATGTLTGTSALGNVTVEGPLNFGLATTTAFQGGTITDPTSGSDNATGIAEDQDYVYVTGYCATCGSGASNNYYTVKYSKSTGAQIWATSTPATVSSGRATGITLDANYLYVTGYCNSGCGQTLGSDAFYTVKYAKSDGSRVWTSTADPTTGSDYAQAITADGDYLYVTGFCLVGGNCEGTGGYAYYTVKLSKSTGAQIWATSTEPGSLNDGAAAITHDEDYVYVTGYCNNTCGSLNVYYTVKFAKATGARVWATTTSASVSSIPTGITEDQDSLYVTGYCASCGATGGTAYYTEKLSKSTGAQMWATSTDPTNGNDYANGLTTDQNYVYVTGYCASCGSGSSNAYYTVNYRKSDGALVLGTTTDPTSGADQANAIVMDQDYMYVTGYCTSCGRTGGTAFYTTKYDKDTFRRVDGSNTFSFGTNASTTNFIVNGGVGTSSTNTISLPSVLSIYGNFSQQGQIATNAAGTIHIASTTGTQMLGGNFTGINALNNLSFIGGSEKLLYSNASTSNFTIGVGATVTSPYVLTVASDFTNSGLFNQNGTLNISSTSNQTLSGNLASTSALGTINLIGGSTKTFSNNASTSNLTIGTGATMSAPASLSVSGIYTNNGTFTNNSGTTTFSGGGTIATGTLTGASAFYSVVASGTPRFGRATSTLGAVLDPSTATDEGNAITIDGDYLYMAGASSTDYYIAKVSKITGEIIWATSTSPSGGSDYALAIAVDQDGVYVTGYCGTCGSSASNAYYTIKVSKSAGAFQWAATADPTASFDNGNAIVVDADSVYVTGFCGTGCGGLGGTAYYTVRYSKVTGALIWATTTDKSSTGDYAYAIAQDQDSIYVTGYCGLCSSIGDEAFYTIKYTKASGAMLWSTTTSPGLASQLVDATAIIADGSFLYVTGACYNCGSNTAFYTEKLSKLDGSRLWATTTDPTSGADLPYAIAQDAHNIYVTGDCGAPCSSYTIKYSKADASFVDATSTEDTMVTFGNLGATADSEHIYTIGSCISCGTRGANAAYISKYLLSNLETVGGSNSMTFSSNASTTHLFIQSSGTTTATNTLVAPARLSIAGNFAQNGIFNANSGTTTFNGTTAQTATGTLTATSSFYNLAVTNTTGSTTFAAPITVSNHFVAVNPSSILEFTSGATSTFNTVRIAGGSGTEIKIRATIPGTQAGFDVNGAYSISYVDIKDSRACGGNGTNTAAVASIDGTNNTCWTFSALMKAALSSAANQIFSFGAATTTLSTLTITDQSTPSITAANDLRIKISTSTVRMLFDTTDTSATLGGTASGKVSGTVSYEGGGSVLVVPVDTDFNASDTLTIGGLSFTQFTAVNIATTALGIYLDGPTDTGSDNSDDKLVTITGSMTLGAHAAGQVSDVFTTPTVTEAELFRYKLTPAGENTSATTTIFTLSGVNGLIPSDLTSIGLYRDINADGIYAAGDVQVGGTPTLSLTGQSGTLTFGTPFSATTSLDYLLVANLANIRPGDQMTVSLPSTGITTIGSTTLAAITASGSVATIQHLKSGGGSRGVTNGGEVGGDAPVGQGDVGGGGAGSNGGVSLEDDPGFFAPSSQGTPQGAWTSGANGYNSDGAYATAASTNLRHSYGNFGFNVPTNNTITGIEVKIEASGTTAAGSIEVKLSWDGGASLTSAKTAGTLTGTDAIYTLGSPSDTWGRSWTPSEFTNANFKIEVISQPNSNTVQIDAIRVNVNHQTGGGGGGGGGEVSIPSSRFFANAYSAVGESLLSLGELLKSLFRVL